MINKTIINKTMINKTMINKTMISKTMINKIMINKTMIYKTVRKTVKTVPERLLAVKLQNCQNWHQVSHHQN